jgi:hypothetical protein
VKIVASLLLTTLFAAGPRARVQSPIESTARQLVSNFAAGQFEAATRDFNDELRPMVTKEVLARVKQQLDQSVGSFVMVKEVRQQRQDGFRAIEIVSMFTRGVVSVVVVFDTLDHVGAVYFNPIVAPPVDPALESLARGLLANFVAGRFEEAVQPFDPTMRAQLSAEGLAGLAANIAGTFGKFQSVTEVHQRDDRIYKVIDLTLAYTKAPVAFRVAFDARRRVAALSISPYYKE